MIGAAELEMLRADAVREMPDLVDIRRLVEDRIHPDTLVAEAVFETVHANVPAFITRSIMSRSWVEQGGRPLDKSDYSVVVAPEATGIESGDIIVPLNTGDSDVPVLVVLAVTTGSATAGRRLLANEFGSGQTEPTAILTGFGLSPFGTAPFGG